MLQENDDNLKKACDIAVLKLKENYSDANIKLGCKYDDEYYYFSWLINDSVTIGGIPPFKINKISLELSSILMPNSPDFDKEAYDKAKNAANVNPDTLKQVLPTDIGIV